MTKETIYRSIAFFLLAGFCEIGGGYMVWIAIKNKLPLWVGILGAIMLVVYGVIVTLQPAGFGRTYAAYGGVFVIMALLWGWVVDKTKPDLYDVIGAAIILVGTIVIFYAPRKVLAFPVN
jgi:small multidrug resistance family-3 protein